MCSCPFLPFHFLQIDEIHLNNPPPPFFILSILNAFNKYVGK
jgi:hypothetical protein